MSSHACAMKRFESTDWSHEGARASLRKSTSSIDAQVRLISSGASELDTIYWRLRQAKGSYGQGAGIATKNPQWLEITQHWGLLILKFLNAFPSEPVPTPELPRVEKGNTSELVMLAEKTLKRESDVLQHIKLKAWELSDHCRTLLLHLDHQGRSDNEEPQGKWSGHYLIHYDMARFTTSPAAHGDFDFNAWWNGLKCR